MKVIKLEERKKEKSYQIRKKKIGLVNAIQREAVQLIYSH